jgi:hypothetical protein
MIASTLASKAQFVPDEDAIAGPAGSGVALAVKFLALANAPSRVGLEPLSPFPQPLKWPRQGALRPVQNGHCGLILCLG